ncbi:hypothetical protein JW933_06355 [candidate division FCPU426 bacterium]|nr:hypothetical protein [candidate division FCPU426 bacterium]
MKKCVFFLLLSITAVACAQAAMTAEQYQYWLTNYYRQPSPARIIPAFEFFIRAEQSGAAVRNDDERCGQARYFSLLAKNHPEILRRGEQLFTKLSWPEKETMLKVFERFQDPQLRSSLLVWAQAEEDDDRRIQIQQAALAENSEDSVFAHPIRSLAQLEEQWAFFFAVGDTRVVDASIALMGNTVVGYCRPKESGTAGVCELYPRERRLRDSVTVYLLHYAARHPRIRDHVLQQTWLPHSAGGESVLEAIAYQALDARNADLAKTLLKKITWRNDSPVQRLHYTGAVAALEGRDQEVKRILQELESKDPVWAEWLRGYYAYNKQLRAEKTWQDSAIPAGGKSVPLLCGQTLEQAKSVGFYETWSLHYMADRLHPHVYLRQYVNAVQVPDLCFHLEILSRPEAAWIKDGRQVRRRGGRQQDWIVIESKIIQQQVVRWTGIDPIKQLLASQYPKTILKVFTQEGEYARLTYARADPSVWLDDMLQQEFPGQVGRITKVQLWVNPAKGEIVRMEVAFEIYQDERLTAAGIINRVFYGYNDLDLLWAKSK